MLNPKDKYGEVEKILVEGGKKFQAKKDVQGNREDLKNSLRDTIAKRKKARAERNPEEVKRLSKVIQKEIKAISKAIKTAKVSQILEEVKDLGKIADTRNKGKKECINAIVDEEGKELTDMKDIVEAFADFYESLYKEDADNIHEYKLAEDSKQAAPITPKEVRAQLRTMKNNKASDDAGIVSELLKEASESMIEAIADIFTEILTSEAPLPTSWKQSFIKVLFKKGDPKLPGNYRPVCIIPIMYKVFSKIICERIKGILLAEQSCDQAGFRPDFGCEDHLFTMTMLAEKCKEFNIPLWAAAIDFSKAFDSISHRSIFEALREQGVPAPYLNVLTKLYKE